jgi:Leucine-rich repeat (LRR) protein
MPTLRLLWWAIEINTNGDDEIQVSEAEAYDGTIDVDNQGIADMTGLEAFVNLTRLECSYNQLTSLDVSANTALTDLGVLFQPTDRPGCKCQYRTNLPCDCSNQLTSLDVSANTALTYLDCYSNQLTEPGCKCQYRANRPLIAIPTN